MSGKTLKKIPDDLSVEGYVKTEPLPSDASLSEVISTLNEVIQKTEELIEILIGES